MLHNAVVRANPSDAGPQLLHVRQNVRQAKALLPEAPGASTARCFDFARCRSQECSHTDGCEGSTPAVRPGRSGPFRIETILLDEVPEIGGIQVPLNPRPVREFMVPLTERLLRNSKMKLRALLRGMRIKSPRRSPPQIRLHRIAL